MSTVCRCRRLERGHLGHRHLPVPVHDQSLDDSVRSSRSVIPDQLGPVLVFGNALTIGGTASTSTTSTTGTTSTTSTTQHHRRCRGQRPHVHRG